MMTATLAHRPILENVVLLAARVGHRIFKRDELRQAYLKLSDPNVELHSRAGRLAFFMMRVLRKLGLIQAAMSFYFHRLDRNPSIRIYDGGFLNLTLNRIYDMPDVEVDSDRPRSINILVPAFDFNSMSAGFFGVFQTGLFMKSCGYRVRLVLFDNFWYDEAAFRNAFQNYPGLESVLDELECEYIGERRAPLRVNPGDMCVATVWYSAYFAEKIMNVLGGRPFIYLIQDYEANFHAGSSVSALADRSYEMSYHALFSTAALERFFVERDIGGIRSRGLIRSSFNNACSCALPDRTTFVQRKEGKAKKTLAFYCRPIVNRNMFELGALTLVKAVEAGILRPDEWEFHGIGLGDCSINLAKDVRLLQMPRMTLKEYRQKISDFDVCLSLMASPHPSLVPFDLAGSGAIVLTNSFANKTQEYFAPIADNVICCEPHLPSLLDGMTQAVARAGKLDERHAAAASMRYPRDWSETWTDEHREFVDCAMKFDPAAPPARAAEADSQLPAPYTPATASESPSLTEIGARLGCDKVTVHDYGPIYERYLRHRRDEPLKILEIGIGGEDVEVGGQSLAMWEEYFPRAEIFGIDIYDKSVLDRPRVQTICANQGDQARMREIAVENGPFDLIIDDGSHKAGDVLASMWVLLQHVKPGGYYVIEDLQTSYWPDYGGSSIAGSMVDTPVRWLKTIIDVVNSGELVNPDHIAIATGFLVDELHAHHNIAFLRRAAAPSRSQLLTDERRAARLRQDLEQLGEQARIETAFERDLALKRDVYKGLGAVRGAFERAHGTGSESASGISLERSAGTRRLRAGATGGLTADRAALLLRGLDKETMTGVEIGAFHSPLAPKARGWRTTVVDFTDAPTLRHIAETHSNELVRSLRDAIEEVDVVWRGQPLADLCLERVPEGYDFLIASHVIEHLPDLLEFFVQASKLLKPTGVISLAVPDMRRCFDALQSPTNTAHILTAHHERRTKHSPQTLLETWVYGCASKGVGGWAPTADLDLSFCEPIDTVWQKYQAHLDRAGDADYIDAHAWRFTPSSFQLTILELNAIGLIDFVVTSSEPGPCSEFIVRMERGSVRRPNVDLHAKRMELMLARHRELAEAFE